MRRMAARLIEVAESAGALAVVVGLVWFLVAATTALRPEPPGDGLRREPPAVVGARVVSDMYGEGVITDEIAYWDGPKWRIRLLSSGRHVVLYRSEFRVLEVVQ